MLKLLCCYIVNFAIKFFNKKPTSYYLKN
ncbi:MAG TPA: hypothetical protein DDY52_03505 [Candidatus Moranbacteria bacterium]|nr:hypothetical protein [Candidatus Moranbacteria bacterium]